MNWAIDDEQAGRRSQGLIEGLWLEAGCNRPRTSDYLAKSAQHQLAESLCERTPTILPPSWVPYTCGGYGKSPCINKGSVCLQAAREVIEAAQRLHERISANASPRLSRRSTPAPSSTGLEFRDHSFPTKDGPPDWHGGPPPKPRGGDDDAPCRPQAPSATHKLIASAEAMVLGRRTRQRSMRSPTHGPGRAHSRRSHSGTS